MLCQPETEIHFVEGLEQTNKEELINDRMFNYKSVAPKRQKWSSSCFAIFSTITFTKTDYQFFYKMEIDLSAQDLFREILCFKDENSITVFNFKRFSNIAISR